MAENEKELKNTFMRLIDETEKAGLKLGIQKKKYDRGNQFHHFTANRISGSCDRFYFPGF